MFFQATSAGVTNYLIGHGDAVLSAASGSHKDGATTNGSQTMTIHIRLRTNTSKQIKTRQDRSTGNHSMDIEIKGFVLARGANV